MTAEVARKKAVDTSESRPPGVQALVDRVRRRWEEPRFVDSCLALAVAAASLAHDYWDDERVQNGYVFAFDIALALPLMWRRRQPLAVFFAIAAISLAQWLTDTLASGDVALLGALYAVGAYDARRYALLAAAATASVGALLATLRWNPSGDLAASALLLTGTITAPWVFGRYVRTRREFLESVLERAATAERGRDEQAVQAVAAERARISRELHDIVAHSLSVMVALSDGAAMAFETAPREARDAMQQTSTLGRQALGEMHRLLNVTRESGGLELAPQPGVAELEHLVAQVRSAGLPVEMTIVGEPIALPRSAQLAVYRVVQESLTNVLKHAQRTANVSVTLIYLTAGVDVQVDNDDDPALVLEATPNLGRGLTGMRERFASVGGTLEASRRGDGGWRVAGHLELEPDEGPP